MVSAFSTNKRIEQPAFNDYIDTWHTPVNANWAIIDAALGGVSTINLTGLTGVRVLTPAEYQKLKIRLTGTPTGNVTVTVPSPVGGMWVVQNDATGSFVESFASAAAPAILVAAPQGSRTLMTCDGTSSGMSLAINSPPTAAGLATHVQYHGPGGVLAGAPELTWNNTTKVLSTGGLINSGNTTLGNAAGDVLTVIGSAVSFSTTSGLIFNGDHFALLGGAGEQVAIGTTTAAAADKLTVAGRIKSTSGGIVFPDNTVQTTAATGGGGTGTAAGSTTQVQYNSGGSFAASSSFTFNGTTLTVPSLALTTALPVAEGGTGVTTSTGSGAGVHATAPALVSPAMTGTPTAITAAVGTNTTQVATTAFVNAQIANQLGDTRILAKGYFQITGTTVNILKSSGVTSIVRVSPGRYTVTMSSAAPDALYVIQATAAYDGNPGSASIGFEWAATSRSTTTFQIGGSSGGGIIDPVYMNFIVFA